MFPVAAAWAEAYEDAVVVVDPGGSGTGIDALIDGTVDIALSSRPVTKEEIGRSYERRGRVPKAFLVGNDAVTVLVSKANPIEEISLERLAQVFGKGGSVTRWSQLGVTIPDCADDRIVTVRRSETSGTGDVFRRKVLGESGAYRDGTIRVETTRDLVTLIELLPCAIGYGGMGFRTDGVKVLRIATADGASVGPSGAAPRGPSGEAAYPLNRPLYMVTLGEPRAAVRAFIDWVLSEEGQKILVDLGEFPAAEG